MFNLDNAIANWRRQMGAAGIQAPACLDELESHLREDVERQTRSGTTLEKAFEFAVAHIGEASVLKAEFAKTRRARSAMENVRIAIAVVLVGFITFLSLATYFLCYTTLNDRLVLAATVACILAMARYWPRAVPFLPVIPDKRKRKTVALACIFTGFGIATFVCQIILPHFVHPDENMTPPVVFCIVVPIAVGFGLGCGIDRAGSKETSQSA
jgi:hypothetical protein